MKIVTITDFGSKYVPDVSLLAKTFIEESNYNLTYSIENSLSYFGSVIEDENQEAIVAVNSNDKVVGGVIVAKVTEWHVESFGYLLKMYVHPDYRNTSAAAKLLKAACKWFDERNCVQCFATSTANIDRDKAFESLMSRYGFYPAGPTLIRGL